MQDKENVCVETTATEQGSEIHSAMGAEQEKVGSTDLGKFKDVNALMQAYTALQAEFTRRSQRLKRYEKEEENQVRDGAAAQKRTAASARTDASTQSEQRPSLPEEESIATTTVDVEGVQETDSAQVAGGVHDTDGTKETDDVQAASDIAQENTAAENATETAANVVGAALKASVAKEQTLSLYEQVMANEEVRLKVIGDYLSSIGKNGAPLLVGGRGVMQTPPKKPSSISDAGKMALAYLKTQGGGVAE